MNIDKPEQILGIQLMNMFMNQVSSKDKTGMFDIMMQAVMESIEKGDDNNVFKELLDGISSTSNNKNSKTKLDSLEMLKSYDELNDGSSINSLNELNNLSANSYRSLGSNVSGSTERINKAVTSAAKKYGVDEALIHAIIKNESNYNPNAVSSAGAMGLMQLMPINCREDGVTDPYNIEQNINAGTKQIKRYINMFNGNLQMALMAYNAGEGTMQRRGVTSINDLYKMPKETQNYVKKVMATYTSLL